MNRIRQAVVDAEDLRWLRDAEEEFDEIDSEYQATKKSLENIVSKRYGGDFDLLIDSAFVESGKGDKEARLLVEEEDRLRRHRQSAWSRRWDLRVKLGFDPRTGKPRQKERSRAPNLPGAGFYPDLLHDDPTDVYGWPRGQEAIEVETYTSNVWHHTSEDGTFHVIQYFKGYEPVSGMTLRSKRAYRGQQTATIDRVFTLPEHQRQGYAREIMDYARSHFRRVKHSKDLTDMGRLWKRGVG